MMGADQDGINVRIDPIPRFYCDATEAYSRTSLAGGLLPSASCSRAERFDPNCQSGYSDAVSDGPIDYNSGPTVRDGDLGEPIAHNADPKGATRIDYKNTLVTRFRKEVENGRVIFESPQCFCFATEKCVTAETAELKCAHL